MFRTNPDAPLDWFIPNRPIFSNLYILQQTIRLFFCILGANESGGMSRTALYRKYRSRALDEVVGQDHITSVLDVAISSGQSSHAYLLTGPRGIGKTSVARIIAHMVNDLPYDDQDYVDIIEIDAASNTGVDNIRDLREKANIMPTSAKYKIYIIDEVHMLSAGAFNALLKTLEEPPEHVIFILATTEAQKLPATILSRTQRFHFRPVETEKVAKHLRMIADKEKIKIDDEALNLIARRGEGSFRDSITLLDQISGLGKEIAKKDIEDILGLIPEDEIVKLAEAVTGHKSKEVVAILRTFREQGITANVIVEQLIDKLTEVADGRSRVYELIEKLIDIPKSANPEVKLLAVLASASSGAESVATSSAPVVTVVAKEKPADISKPKPEPKKSTIKEKPKPTPKAEAENTPKKEKSVAETKTGNAIADIDWDKVVAEAKQINGVCGSLIGGASAVIEDGVLTLYYNHKIHRNKMKDNKCRKILSDSLMNIYDSVPKIVVADAPKPKSETASKVADIMGGGEIL